MIRKILYKETELFGIKEKTKKNKKFYHYDDDIKSCEVSLTIYEFEPSARNILFFHELKETNINYFLSFPYFQVIVAFVKKNSNGLVFAGMTKTPYDPQLIQIVMFRHCRIAIARLQFVELTQLTIM